MTIRVRPLPEFQIRPWVWLGTAVNFGLLAFLTLWATAVFTPALRLAAAGLLIAIILLPRYLPRHRIGALAGLRLCRWLVAQRLWVEWKLFLVGRRIPFRHQKICRHAIAYRSLSNLCSILEQRYGWQLHDHMTGIALNPGRLDLLDCMGLMFGLSVLIYIAVAMFLKRRITPPVVITLAAPPILLFLFLHSYYKWELSDTAMTLRLPIATNDQRSQQVEVDATGGIYRLKLGTKLTGPFTTNVAARIMQAAPQNLPGVGAGNVTVWGEAGGPYTVVFSEKAMAGRTPPLLTAETTALSKGGTVSIKPMAALNLDLRETLAAIYMLTLALCTIAAAVRSRRNDPRILHHAHDAVGAVSDLAHADDGAICDAAVGADGGPRRGVGGHVAMAASAGRHQLRHAGTSDDDVSRGRRVFRRLFIGSPTRRIPTWVGRCCSSPPHFYIVP